MELGIDFLTWLIKYFILLFVIGPAWAYVMFRLAAFGWTYGKMSALTELSKENIDSLLRKINKGEMNEEKPEKEKQ